MAGNVEIATQAAQYLLPVVTAVGGGVAEAVGTDLYERARRILAHLVKRDRLKDAQLPSERELIDALMTELHDRAFMNQVNQFLSVAINRDSPIRQQNRSGDNNNSTIKANSVMTNNVSFSGPISGGSIHFTHGNDPSN